MTHPLPSSFTVTALSPEGARKALPALQAQEPGLTAEAWAEICRGYVQGRGMEARGIVGVQDARGYVHGLFCYARASRDGIPTLEVDHMVALGIFDPSPIMDAMLSSMEGIARAAGCTRVLLRAGDTTRGLAGYAAQGEVLVRDLAIFDLAGAKTAGMA